jgi:hypothetical protein
MNSSGQILCRISVKERTGTGCYEAFWATRAAGLPEDHSELRYFEVFNRSNNF